jgi:PAS domain S-box-containing protein
MHNHAFVNWSAPLLTRVDELRAATRRQIDRWRGHIGRNEWRHARVHLAALGLVAATAAARYGLGITADSPFWLFHVSVAIAAGAWGFSPAAVAALGALLAARTVAAASWPSALLFVVEALALAAVIVRVTRALQTERRRMRDTDAWLMELKSTERLQRIVDAALSRLDAAAPDCAIIILDSHGRITDWRAGATRLYGREQPTVLGASAAVLFGGDAESQFEELLSLARQGPVRRAARQHHAFGQAFDAELEISPLSRGGFDGFALVIRDLTGQQAREALRLEAVEAFTRLQEEAATAQRQLETLQHVTDPSLNSLESAEFVTTLLERLRTAIDAEGIALVRLGRFRRRVFAATGGLQCVRGVTAPVADLGGGDPGRTLMIHNDAAAVLESSAAVWPVGVSSLMSVPVVRAGARQAVMEVVNRTGRRATEWEIALVQVAAARIAGFLRDDSYADAGAVA